MTIKEIFDEINSVSGDKDKMLVLSKYSDNELLKQVLYLCKSKRVKFFIKQLPIYESKEVRIDLDFAISELNHIIKREVTGADALNFLGGLLESLSPEDAYILERIIDKDPKIGMGTTFINKVIPKLIEETNYMGAKSFDMKLVEKIFKKGVAISQLKADGRYCAALVSHDVVEMESRSGEVTHLTNSKVITELSKLGEEIVLTGELTMKNISTKYSGSSLRSVSNGIIASLIDICGKRVERGEEETLKKIEKFETEHSDDFQSGLITFQEALDCVTYIVWDCVSFDEYFNGKSDVKYSDRLSKVTKIIQTNNLESVHLIETRVVNNIAEAFSHFKEILDLGLEGTILKTTDDGWKDGKPNYCVKLKLEVELDLVITGFNYGTKGTKNEKVISSLMAESRCGKLKTKPQGLSEEKMKFVTENQDKLLGSVISVKCNGVSKPKTSDVYALMYPAFLEFRGDEKTLADSLEEILLIELAAIELASK